MRKINNQVRETVAVGVFSFAGKNGDVNGFACSRWFKFYGQEAARLLVFAQTLGLDNLIAVLDGFVSGIEYEDTQCHRYTTYTDENKKDHRLIQFVVGAEDQRPFQLGQSKAKSLLGAIQTLTPDVFLDSMQTVWAGQEVKLARAWTGQAKPKTKPAQASVATKSKFKAKAKSSSQEDTLVELRATLARVKELAAALGV
jgi:hypothetical protein